MRILSVTGSRSDYSLMSKLFRLFAIDESIEHHLFVTGMLLEDDHKDILELIRKDQFGTLHQHKTFLDGHDSRAMAHALGRTIISVTDVLNKVRPQFVVLQGDRGEMLAAAVAAAHLNIAVVHLSGGDRTGSIDDSIRNAISKFAHLHLTTCQESADRLLAMGESKSRISVVGEPGLDVLLEKPLLGREDFERQFGLRPEERFLLACQHPVTSEVDQTQHQIDETIEALKSTGLKTIFTFPNNDTGSEIIIAALRRVSEQGWIVIEKNLGSQRFLSALKYASALVGNSSSGIWEAPSFRTPVVNIGTRQHGRLRAGNVIDVPHDRVAIERAIQSCLSDPKFKESLSRVINPYGDGKSSVRIVELLKEFRLPTNFVEKWLDQ